MTYFQEKTIQALVLFAGIFLIALGLIMVTPSPAEAASCGGVNQRACKLWERAPSCFCAGIMARWNTWGTCRRVS